MWILPTSISSRFAAEQGSLTSESVPPSPGVESEPALWLTVTGKPRLARRSDRVWKSRPWSRLLFGAGIFRTSRQQAFTEWWTQCQPAFRASRSVGRGSNLGRKMNGTFCRLSSTSPIPLELPFCSSKMSVGSKNGSTISPRSYFKGGGIVSGELSARPMLEPVTAGSDGLAWHGEGISRESFWPTANARVSNDREEPETWLARAQRTKEATGANNGLPLTVASVSFWPTASARDHKDTSGMATDGVNPDGSHRSRLDQLPRMATQWTTACARDAETPARLTRGAGSVEKGNANGVPLGVLATNWATPRVTTNGGVPTEHTGRGSRIEDQACSWQTVTAQDAESRTSQKQRDGSRTLALCGEAVEWASPRAGSHTGPDNSNREGSPTIQTQASQFLPPVLPIPDGPTSSPDTLSLPPLSQYRQWLCGMLGVAYSEDLAWRLNPAFTCWLMGWHPLWTSLIPILPPGPINSASPATACAGSKPPGPIINS